MPIIKPSLKNIEDLVRNDKLEQAFSQLNTILTQNPSLDEKLQQLPFQQIRNRALKEERKTYSKEEIKKSLLELLAALDKEAGFVLVTDSKNVVTSSISAGGSVHVGDIYNSSNPYAGKHFLTRYDNKLKTFYLCRTDILAEVYRLLKEHQYVTIYGASGVGKSTLASIFIEQYKDDYTSIGWINYEISLVNIWRKQLGENHPNTRLV